MDMIDRILGLIEKNNITAKQLTKQLGVNQSTVSEWKKHKTKPSVEHVRKMADIFGVSTDYIINGKDKKHITNNDIDSCIDNTMLDVYKRLTTEHKNAVRDFFYMCICEYESANRTLNNSEPENHYYDDIAQNDDLCDSNDINESDDIYSDIEYEPRKGVTYGADALKGLDLGDILPVKELQK